MDVTVTVLHGSLSLVHSRPQGLDVIGDRELIAAIYVQRLMRNDIAVIFDEVLR